MVSTGVLINPYPDQEGNELIFRSEWREFPSAPCLAGEKNLMTARVSMLLKSRASLICFRACLFPGRAKDFSAPLVYVSPSVKPQTCYFNHTFFLQYEATVELNGYVLFVYTVHH